MDRSTLKVTANIMPRQNRARVLLEAGAAAPREQHLPLAQYFLRVGGVLFALLLALNAYLPKLPVADRAQANLSVIRIHSDRKWPERVVFDTRIQAIIPAQVASIEPSSRPRKRPATSLPRRAGARRSRRCNHPIPGSCNRPLQKSGNRGRNIRAGSQGNTRRRITRQRHSGNLIGMVKVSGEEVSRRVRAYLGTAAALNVF